MNVNKRFSLLKYCTKCKILLTKENHYFCDVKRGRYICKSCNYKENRKWAENNPITTKRIKERYRKREWETMHNLKINGCSICGYNKCDAALEFHHVIPKDRSFYFGFGNISRKDIDIINELNKCILLCANCHKEIHYKGRDYDEKR